MANLFSINNGKVTYNKVNINDIQTTVNSKNKVKQKKKTYKEELKVQNKLQNNINEYFGRQGVMVNTDNFGNTTRAPLVTQQHANYVKNGFSVNRDSLTQNVKTEQQYQQLLKSEDYQQKKQDLINQSNIVGYSKYDYDKALVENDKIGWYDKSTGRLIEGAKSIFDISGGMIKNENGDYVYLPNKTELKSQKVNDSYETGVGKFLGNAAYEIGKIGGTTLVNSVVPYAGSTAYFGRMFMDSTNNAIREGYTQDKAINYALVNTTLEFVTGKLLGSATKGLTGGTNNQLSNAISNGVNKLIKNPSISSFIGNAGSEATEEFIQEYLDNINRLVTLEGSKNTKDYIDVLLDKNVFEDALYSAGIGALSGGVLGSINNTETRYVKQNTDLFKNFKTQLEETKSNLTNKNEIAKYDRAINSIDDYLQRPFGNELKAQNVLPTVQEIVAQESTKKIDSSTRDVSNNTKILRAFEPSISANNIAQSNEGVNYNLDKEHVSKNISQDIDNILNNINERNPVRLRDYTPSILVKNGIKDLPMYENPAHIRKNILTENEAKRLGLVVNSRDHYHGLGKDLYIKVINSLDNPRVIFKRNNSKDYLILTTLKDNNNNNIIVPIEIETSTRVNKVKLDINRIKTVYGYETINNIDLNDYIKHNIKNNNLEKIYEQKKEQGTGFSTVASSFSDNNIPQINDNVKLPVISNNNTQNIASNTNNINSLEKTAPPMKNHQSKNNKKSNKSKQIAKILNETMQNDSITVKQRRWIETSLESDPVKDKVIIEDLDDTKITYVVQSNKKTLNKANSKLNSMGYDTAVKYIQSQINSNDVTLTDVALAERLIQESIKKGDNQLASELIVDTAILGTELGQKVQALSMIQRLTPEGQLLMYQRLVQRAKAKGDTSFQNVEITPEMVDLILNAYNKDGTFNQDDLNSRVEQFKEKVAEQLITTTSEKVVAWRYLSMLGNPKTHIRNVVSNIAMWGTLKVKNATARTIETIAPIKNRTKTWKKASKDVANFAKQTTQEMKGIITGESKYNEKTSIESKKQIFKNKTLEKIKDFNSNMLSEEDWLFSRTAFESTFKEYLTAQGIETKADIENNSEIVEKAKLYALEQAEIATFRQYSWLASQISKIENKNIATKLAVGSTIPFKKTPINIAKAGINYSPIGLLKSISYDVFQVSQGNMEASQMIDNISQGLTGTSLALIGYALAKAGLLKGAGDDDKEGKYDSYLGNQTYSIKIGDSTYSISWLSPVAMPLLVGATAYEKLEEQSEWDMNVLVDTLAQTLDPLSEMSFLSSLDDVLSSYDSGMKKFTGMAESMAQNYITQFIPTLFSQIANTLDDKKRTTRASNNSSWKFGEETIRKIMYKIPIARNQLEASTDIWGNEIEQSDNILERAFESFIAPYSKKKDISTDLDSELKRLYNSTGETGVIPGVPKGFIKYEDVTYQLSSNEYTQLKKTYGTTANKYLQSLLKNKVYKNATDEEKANMVKEIFQYASVISKEEYFKDKDIEYTNDTLNKVNKLRELDMNINQITEYVSNQKVISTIKNNKNLTTQDKKSKISNLLIDANLNDKQLAFLYGSYYSSEETLNNLLDANIPIKEFIKLNSKEFTTDYYTNGKAISNSRKLKVIKYVNSLNLSVAQKAILIKMEYSSYDKYDKQIVSYVNKMNYSKFEKASLLKSFGFDYYDKYLIQYVNNMNITKVEKEEILKEMGFTIRNGRVYS